MLKPVQRRTTKLSTTSRFAIVAAKYNPKYSNALVRFAKAELKLAGVTHIDVVRVPGAFEVPVVAGHLSRATPAYDAILCFGTILRGATTHADHIASGVTAALAQLQITSGVPIIHGVLMFENHEQAKVRCLGRESNRGIEAAHTAMEMAEVMRTLPTHGM